MKIIAHRQNEALQPDADGHEIDVWATAGGLEVRHDLNNNPGHYFIEAGSKITLQSLQAGELVYSTPPIPLNKQLFEVLSEAPGILAINAKSCGLAETLPELLKGKSNYFIFDAAVPESLKMLAKGLKVYTRWSEYENEPSFYEHAHGVWVDSMVYMQPQIAPIAKYLEDGKEVCLVSPELHGKPYRQFWSLLKQSPWYNQVSLCTKHVEEAKEYFNGKK